MRIAVADVGGTNARFALAELRPGARPRLGEIRRYATADHDGLPSAWRQFLADTGERPACASLAVAVGLDADLLRFPNSPWVIDRRTLQQELELDRMLLLNDFGAVAQAVSVLDGDELMHVAGPQGPLPDRGVTSVIGPGTGLGVAMLLRGTASDSREDVRVIETEGAHIGFAPLSEEEEKIERALREVHGRVSVERVVSGPGLHEIYRIFGGSAFGPGDAPALWSAALAGTDACAALALDQFVKCFGAAAGDFALAHGANAVVLSSGLAQRMADRLKSPLFTGRFIAKGRYRARMERMPVRLAVHAEPGLLGAAVAFARSPEAQSSSPASLP